MKNLRYIAILLTALVSAVASARVWTPQEMVNPNIANRNHYVCDPAYLLDATTTTGVNERLASLRQVTTCEVVVVVVPDIGDVPIEDWSEQVFTRWGVGKKDKDNGAMLVIVPDQRVCRIQTGYGVEGVLTDVACNNIIGRAIIPNMRDGNINAAVNDATQLMCDALTDPAVADELHSDMADNYSGAVSTLSADVVWEFIRIVAGFFFLFGLGLFCYDLWNQRKLDAYNKAMMWRRHLTTYLICGIVSMGCGLAFWLLALWLYRMARSRRIKCPTCGARMKRLSEEEDNELLSPSQDFEEKIKTVDYDVWECPKCGTIERFPFREKQSKYTECTKCHTVAMRLVSDVIRVQPTTTREGWGEKIYECEFCHHRESKPYKIPRKSDGTGAALAAGAILGSMGRGGGGGGSFGGGFGGGMTGGGGASGHW